MRRAGSSVGALTVAVGLTLVASGCESRTMSETTRDPVGPANQSEVARQATSARALAFANAARERIKAQEPLYVVDGETISSEEASAIAPSRIKAVRVLRGARAVAKYAEAGKNGVVEIRLTYDKP